MRYFIQLPEGWYKKEGLKGEYNQGSQYYFEDVSF